MNRNKMPASLLIGILLCSTIAGCIGTNDEETENLGELVVAFEIKADYDNIDENPQILADYLSEKLNYDVSLYSVDSCLLYTSDACRRRLRCRSRWSPYH